MKPLQLTTVLADDFIADSELDYYDQEVQKIHNLYLTNFENKEHLGWHDAPLEDHSALLRQMNELAEEVRRCANILVVIGVGGSFLGARAVQDALTPYFGLHENGIKVVYAGQNMSGAYLKQLLAYIDRREVYVNVVSKSGSTMEPALSFRVIEQYMEKRYGSEAKSRIIVTTDAEEGNLREIVEQKGYRSFAIPKNIGGRYSVLTAAGLFPVAIAGIQAAELLEGAGKAALDLQYASIEENAAYRYAVVRHILHKKGFDIELLASFEPSLKSFHEWWKQLFGESEGKDQKGIFPSTVTFSTDLHAIGQYIQEGRRILFETLLHFNEIEEDLNVPEVAADFDGLNYLSGKSFNEINRLSKEGTAFAHKEGGVPVVGIELQRLDEYHIGYLIYFFMKACAMSAYLLDVNPFDQPGVDAYKEKMLDLLKAPVRLGGKADGKL